ncbi:hypothetical protein [Paenibacillus prosopidis]|uniref:YtkA-like protein n=1 Tax=Paenibacillus prosopidis TaxID=630520 RepID=A0A368VNJ1_9BACL|nr:hypothetical protein [Paenibacillus prosopidis]RCW43054.1 hypothetical protein DFP97_114118 [Paenibacillus prosopidis]
MKRLFITITLVILLVLQTGCSEHTMAELEMPEPAEIVEKPNLDLRIEISGRNATIYVTTNMKIAKEHVGMERQYGEGHIHMYVDDGEKISVKDNKYMIQNLLPGKHKVKVSLHNNDHTPYDVAKLLDFEIK